MDVAALRRTLAGKLVLIGSRTKVDQDLVLTPGHSGFGVDYHAEVVNTLISRQFLQRWPSWLQLGILLLLNATIGYATFRSRPNAIPLAAGWLGWAALCWFSLALGKIMPIVSGFIGMLATWAVIAVWRIRQGQQLMKIMGGYVAPEVLQEMLAAPERWTRSLTQRREVTVLFSDINDFSTSSEQQSPETVASWLDQHYREMARIIFLNHGTVLRFVGDQFMVLFGAPQPCPHPEAAAVNTALAMHRRLAELAALGEPGFFKVKIGIHSGPMLLAVIGDDLKREYTAVGDDCNVAARIQGLCKQAGETTLVSQAIYERVVNSGVCAFEDLGEWPLKGREQKVRLYAPRTPDPG